MVATADSSEGLRKRPVESSPAKDPAKDPAKTETKGKVAPKGVPHVTTRSASSVIHLRVFEVDIHP